MPAPISPPSGTRRPSSLAISSNPSPVPKPSPPASPHSSTMAPAQAFPGIPIAICRPEIAVTLAESQGKKAAFLQEAIRITGIPAKVHSGRAETLSYSIRVHHAPRRGKDGASRQVSRPPRRSRRMDSHPDHPQPSRRPPDCGPLQLPLVYPPPPPRKRKPHPRLGPQVPKRAQHITRSTEPGPDCSHHQSQGVLSTPPNFSEKGFIPPSQKLFHVEQSRPPSLPKIVPRGTILSSTLKPNPQGCGVTTFREPSYHSITTTSYHSFTIKLFHVEQFGTPTRN